MRAYERFLKYAMIHTTSDEEAGTVPSTARQFDLAKALVSEMQKLGISDAAVDEKCYVTGSLPATPGYEDRPSLGFIAHLDTAPSFSGENVRPRIHENYNGEVLRLGESGRVLDPAVFPHLSTLKGRTLITSDGQTLLGADDKAGIAEILTMAEELLSSGEPHGRLCFAFTPDEEIGSGAADLDLEAFGADFAYTVDGGAENEIEYENFNAASAVFRITGVSVHPGDAKNKMVNALLLGMELNAMLPSCDVPSMTEGYEGFFHLTDMKGDVSGAKLCYIVRDHSRERFEDRKALLLRIERLMNEKYGEGTVKLALRDEYRNMLEKIKPCMHLIENAKEAVREAGGEPLSVPIRGGTDGAQLSFRGLPCPNLGTGGYAFHGPYEHITAEGMDFVVRVLLGIVGRYSRKEA